ncbi:VOC family protein [Oryzifoliimicrobium ureilyticus]|uniref:VOC family protein n=1 Tax=Oryzifoliimicrobium ureilyticus TaxID=3113724 RepID=UPI003076577C
MTTQSAYALSRPAHVGAASLVVSDLPMVSSFYQQILGLSVLEKSGSEVLLGVDEKPLLRLVTDRAVRAGSHSAAGLFHNAFLLPSRQDLALWLRHVAHQGQRLDGASDHIVSEAIYLSDPEGNGIEVYADRPHETWRFDRDGMVTMATKRLDLQALYDSAGSSPWEAAPEGTALGHIHLQVGDVPEAERFYSDVLGLKIMARYPGASFFATGSYHHHVAANIWNSRGAGKRDETMTGLSSYELKFNDRDAYEEALTALDRLSIATERRSDGVFLRDPWGIGIVLNLS